MRALAGFLSRLLTRVEKKERARLKTVKFHARTGMIESNRVSAGAGWGEGGRAGWAEVVPRRAGRV